MINNKLGIEQLLANLAKGDLMRNNVGRPFGSTKLNSRMVSDIKQYLSLGFDKKESCIAAGISPITFEKWYKRGAKEGLGIFREFWEAVDPALKEKDQKEQEKKRKITELILIRLKYSGCP